MRLRTTMFSTTSCRDQDVADNIGLSSTNSTSNEVAVVRPPRGGICREDRGSRARPPEPSPMGPQPQAGDHLRRRPGGRRLASDRQPVPEGLRRHRPETRVNVERALDELEYRPNLTARSLKSGRSHRIGALTHEVSQVGPSRVAQGATVAARGAGYVLDLSRSTSNPSAIEESLELMAQLDLAGVLALSSTDAMTRAFEATDFRVPPSSTVAADADRSHPGPHERGPARAHRPPWGPRPSSPRAHRRARDVVGSPRLRLAFETAVATWGLQSIGVMPGDWSARSGYDAIALPHFPRRRPSWPRTTRRRSA